MRLPCKGRLFVWAVGLVLTRGVAGWALVPDKGIACLLRLGILEMLMPLLAGPECLLPLPMSKG